MNELYKKLLIAVVLLSFTAAVGLALTERSQRLAGKAFQLAQICQPMPETCNGRDDDCDNMIDEEGVCGAVMTLNPTSGTPGSGISIHVAGIPSTETDVQWWAISPTGLETQFPGNMRPRADGTIDNAYNIPSTTPAGSLRIELRSGANGQILASAIFMVTSANACGDGVCAFTNGENTNTCAGDCACLSCNAAADDVFELITDERGNDIFFDEFFQQQCSSGTDPIVACQLTKEKCLRDQPLWGNYDPMKCDDAYRHCVAESSKLCGGGPSSCGDGICDALGGENPDTCPNDCRGSGEGQCTDADVDEICHIFRNIPFPDCVSALDTQRDSLGSTCSAVRDFCGSYGDPRLCEEQYMQCLGSGLCAGGGPTDCGDGICGPSEDLNNCPQDCRVVDTDGDGILDVADACLTLVGKDLYQGCPVGDKNIVELHTVNIGGSDSTKIPLSDVEVRVFDRNSTDFQAIAGSKNPNGSLYGVVFEAEAGRVGGCMTGPDGICFAGESAVGDYLVIIKYYDPETNKTVYVGRPKSPGDFVDTDANGIADLATKEFQIIKVYKKGIFQEYRGGSKIVVTGSLLEIIAPESAVWEGEKSVYPFIFSSDSAWSVDVCAQVPGGYRISGVYDDTGALVTSSSCIQSFVNAETKVVAFEVTDVGSPEPSFNGTITLKHKGKNTVQKIEVSDIRKKSFDGKVEEALKKTKGMKNMSSAAFAADITLSNQVQSTSPSNSTQMIVMAGVFLLIVSGAYWYQHKQGRK